MTFIELAKKRYSIRSYNTQKVGKEKYDVTSDRIGVRNRLGMLL